MSQLWWLDQCPWLQKLKGLEMYLRWLDNRDKGSRFEGMKLVCLHNGRLHLRKQFGAE